MNIHRSIHYTTYIHAYRVSLSARAHGAMMRKCNERQMRSKAAAAAPTGSEMTAETMERDVVVDHIRKRMRHWTMQPTTACMHMHVHTHTRKSRLLRLSSFRAV